MAASDALVISPEKRSTVICPPLQLTSSNFTRVPVSSMRSPSILHFIHEYYQANVASARGRADPLRLIHQRLDKKHTQAAAGFFSMYFLVNVGRVHAGTRARAGVQKLELQSIRIHREDHAE